MGVYDSVRDLMKESVANLHLKIKFYKPKMFV